MHTDPAALRLRFLALLGVLPLSACVTGERFESTACLIVEDGATTCPSEATAAEQFVGPGCGTRTLSVDGPGVVVPADGGDTGMANDQCCYPVTKVPISDGCVVGRPYYDEGKLVTAESVRPPGRAEGGWALGQRPSLAGLSLEERRVLAQAWTDDALVEHASVAAFARFALELLAAGAPAALVDDAHAAARDEVRHARLAFALAETYAGGPVAPGPFPFGASVPLTLDLATLAATTAREGCVGETVVALLATEALTRATDPAVRRVLTVVASDEARHAELAWRAVRWMIEAGGARVRDAVAAVFADVAENGVTPPAVSFGAAEDVLAAHGRIRPDAMAAMVERALREVVLPCGDALSRRAA